MVIRTGWIPPPVPVQVNMDGIMSNLFREKTPCVYWILLMGLMRSLGARQRFASGD